MRSHLLLATALVAGLATTAAAQRGRRADTTRNTRRDTPISTSDTRFTPVLTPGQRLSVRNIEGNVTVTQGRGPGAEIVAHKIVRKGNGALVKAILEETSDGYRVCTVYLSDARDDSEIGVGHDDQATFGVVRIRHGFGSGNQSARDQANCGKHQRCD